MLLSSAFADATAPASNVPFPTASSDRSDALLRAAEHLLSTLERGLAIEAAGIRAAMIDAFGSSDAAGAWAWKDAYEACEAAQLLFLRRFGPAIGTRPAAAQLGMLAKIVALVPSQTRRSEESQALQQFSTPLPLAFVAARAAAITPADLVLEPSAGTGLLAVFAELARIARRSG